MKIIGDTSLILRTKESGKLISRALVDCYPMVRAGNWSNLYVDTLKSFQQEADEEYEDSVSKAVTADEVTDLMGSEAIVENEMLNPWKDRLRKRTK